MLIQKTLLQKKKSDFTGNIQPLRMQILEHTKLITIISFLLSKKLKF